MPEVLFGRGRLAEATDRVAAMGARAVLVHGRDGARSAGFSADLAARGMVVTPLSCPGEPTLGMVEGVVAAAREARPDLVVAFGGGAAIDMAKAVAALIPVTRPLTDHLEVVGRGLPLDAPPLPIVAIPTTAGTGSEATRNAVIGVPERGLKVSLRDPRLLPRLAVVDPALTDACPWTVTLASGLDAVTQVIEPYLSARSNPLTDALCLPAIASGLRALVRLAEAEDRDARDEIARVSLTGGIALANAGLGAVHGLAGAIGGRTGAPHGEICAALLPHVLSVNAAAGVARAEDVRDAVTAALGGAPELAFTTLTEWTRAQGGRRLGGMGVAAGDVDAIVAAAQGSSSMKANPVRLPDPVLADVLRSAL